MTIWAAQWAFLIIPIILLAAAYYVWRKRRLRPSMMVSELSIASSVPKSLRARFSELPFWLKVMALILAIIALARPQESNTKVKRNVEGIDIMITFDISDSMLIEDMQPVNRLESAKQTIIDFIQKRVSDRIGLVVFSGEAYTRVPLTLDYKLLLNNVKTVQPAREIKMGTAIGVALANAVGRLKDSTARSRVVIFLTDGENNSGTIDPETAIQIAKGFDIKVYSIGIGRDGDAQLPVMVQDFRGNLVKRYRPIHSQVNDELLGRMAEVTGGRYWRATDSQALQKVFNEINRLEKSKVDVNQFTRYRELFQNFLKWALYFYLAAYVLGHIFLRRSP